jgi:hypothetical protein
MFHAAILRQPQGPDGWINRSIVRSCAPPVASIPARMKAGIADKLHHR